FKEPKDEEYHHTCSCYDPVLKLYVTSKLVIAGELESSTNQELLQSRHYPRFPPKPHWPFRGSRKAFPPLPSGHFQPTPFHPPPEVIKCLSAKDEVRKCFDDIAFFNKKAATGSECCAAIQK
ncbi:unnamed protein product, partial [Brassica napus]